MLCIPISGWDGQTYIKVTYKTPTRRPPYIFVILLLCCGQANPGLLKYQQQQQQRCYSWWRSCDERPSQLSSSLVGVIFIIAFLALLRWLASAPCHLSSLLAGIVTRSSLKFSTAALGLPKSLKVMSQSWTSTMKMKCWILHIKVLLWTIASNVLPFELWCLSCIGCRYHTSSSLAKSRMGELSPRVGQTLRTKLIRRMPTVIRENVDDVV